MKKCEYLDMLVAENTEGENKGLYADVIDCIDIALSQESEDFEVSDTSKGLKDFYQMLADKARKEGLKCIGPFQAAEIFAEALGAKYERLSKRMKEEPVKAFKAVSLEDFL